MLLADAGAVAREELASLASTSTAALAELGEEMRAGQQHVSMGVRYELKLNCLGRVGRGDACRTAAGERGCALLIIRFDSLLKLHCMKTREQQARKHDVRKM